MFQSEHGLMIIGKLMVKVPGKPIGHGMTLNIYFKHIWSFIDIIIFMIKPNSVFWEYIRDIMDLGLL